MIEISNLNLFSNTLVITSGGISALEEVFFNVIHNKKQEFELIKLNQRELFTSKQNNPFILEQKRFGAIVTLDGLSGSGKTTIARELVNALGLAHLESGYVLKAVAKAILDDTIHPSLDHSQTVIEKLAQVSLADVADPRLDQPEYAALVPVFSGLREVQTPFYRTVRRLAKQLRDVVVTGRSIGTQVFYPTDGAIKIFLEVAPSLGAYRKAKQLETIALPNVIEMETFKRNCEDIFNEVITIPPAALTINTDRMTIQEVAAIIETEIRRKTRPSSFINCKTESNE